MPLHFAAIGGHTATVDRLVAAGAAVDAKNDLGRAPRKLLRGSGSASGRREKRRSRVG